MVSLTNTNFRLVSNAGGYALVSALLLVIGLAVGLTVALNSIEPGLEKAREAQTQSALQDLSTALLGEYRPLGSHRGSDFGYFGDNGALPGSLNDLLVNPGLATWRGPYLNTSFVEAGSTVLNDSWGTLYTLAGVTLQSSGSGTPFTLNIAASVTDLTDCGLAGRVVGANNVPPGGSAGSLLAIARYPGGGGVVVSDTTTVAADGSFSFAGGLPIGIHNVLVIDTLAADSAATLIRLLPRSTVANASAGILQMSSATY